MSEAQTTVNEEAIQEENVIPFTNGETDQSNPEKTLTTPSFDFAKLGMGLFPLTPVKFAGEDMPLAIGRIALYGGLAYVMYGKSKKAGYFFAGCAGVSALTSIMSNQWSK